jgi:hypothetical protein
MCTIVAGRRSQVLAGRVSGGAAARTKLDFVSGPLGLLSSSSAQEVITAPGTYEDVVAKTYVPDSLGLIAGEADSMFPGQGITYARTAEGRVTGITTPTSDLQFAYGDPLWGLTTVDLSAARKVTYEYSGAGPPKRVPVRRSPFGHPLTWP